MIQNIAVIIIIAVALAYTIWAVIKKFRNKNSSPCDNCNGCDLKKEINCHLPDKKSVDTTSCGCTLPPKNHLKK